VSKAMMQSRTHRDDKGTPPAKAKPAAAPKAPAKAAAPKPTFKIISETVAAVPANRARHTVGIGEDVTVKTDPATAVAWSVTGKGAVAPAAGNTTTFTAAQSPSKPVVHAKAGAEEHTIAFNVVAPIGMTSKVKSNTGPPGGTKGPPNNQISARTIFDCTVIPTSVSFDNAQFRENIPKVSFKWPDGTADGRIAEIVPWTTTNNKTTDTIYDPPVPITRLDKAGKRGNLWYRVTVPEEYQDDGGTWVSWLPKESHLRDFVNTGQARMSLEASDNAVGSWQGPWQ
jgi:hypothetical protein